MFTHSLKLLFWERRAVLHLARFSFTKCP